MKVFNQLETAARLNLPVELLQHLEKLGVASPDANGKYTEMKIESLCRSSQFVRHCAKLRREHEQQKVETVDLNELYKESLKELQQATARVEQIESLIEARGQKSLRRPISIR